MGKIRETWVKERFLELTDEDIQKAKKRRQRKQDGEFHPKLLAWHRRFADRLAKCPVCGETPHMLCIWCEHYGYEYKFCCNFCHYIRPDGHTGDMGCGDWYRSLSRAGLSWNYRVKEALGAPHKVVRHYPLTSPFVQMFSDAP